MLQLAARLGPSRQQITHDIEGSTSKVFDCESNRLLKIGRCQGSIRVAQSTHQAPLSVAHRVASFPKIENLPSPSGLFEWVLDISFSGIVQTHDGSRSEQTFRKAHTSAACGCMTQAAVDVLSARRIGAPSQTV
jgi:hypothetical protein